jgi:hypothetical protein
MLASCMGYERFFILPYAQSPNSKAAHDFDDSHIESTGLYFNMTAQ